MCFEGLQIDYSSCPKNTRCQIDRPSRRLGSVISHGGHEDHFLLFGSVWKVLPLRFEVNNSIARPKEPPEVSLPGGRLVYYSVVTQCDLRSAGQLTPSA